MKIGKNIYIIKTFFSHTKIHETYICCMLLNEQRPAPENNMQSASIFQPYHYC